MRRLAILILAAAALCSCSIKEDRADCPVWLYFPEGFDARDAWGEVSLFAYEKGCGALTKRQTASLEALLNREERPWVSKGETAVSLVRGLVDMELQQDSLLVIPYGLEADPVVAARDHFETYAERWTVRDSLFRQYAATTVRMEFTRGEVYPYAVRVRGSWCGFRLQSLSAVEGPFYYMPTGSGNGVFSFNLPRQGDDSLMLEVWGSDDPGEPASLLDELPLGQYIRRTQYDWTARDLGPVDIDINYARATISITVNDWTEEFALVVTI